MGANRIFDSLDFDMKPHAKRVGRIRRLLENPRSLRGQANLPQEQFWRKYGLTQSAGSRHENGRSIQRAAQVLMVLEELGYVSEDQLIEAVRLVEEAGLSSWGKKRHRSGE